MPEPCSQLAVAAGEQLTGTASQAEHWLLLEVRSGWGRDVVADTDLPPRVGERLQAWLDETPRSRVLFIRKPERRSEQSLTLFIAQVGEHGGQLRRLELEQLEDVLEADLGPDGEAGPVPLWLVCTHGRRDPCCARLGGPLYEALRETVPAEALWQSSHQGGHRFAANLLVLPFGIQLGRVRPVDARSVVDRVENRVIPLAHYRGRTIYPPAVQAAEAAVRSRLGLVELTALAHDATHDGRVAFLTPHGPVTVAVDEQEGPSRPESCGAEPTPTRRYTVRW